MFRAILRQLFRRLKHTTPRRVQIGLNRRAGLYLSRYSRAIARAVHPPPTGPHSRHKGHHGPQAHHVSPDRHRRRSSARRFTSPFHTRPPARFHRGSCSQAARHSPARRCRANVDRHAAPTPTL